MKVPANPCRPSAGQDRHRRRGGRLIRDGDAVVVEGFVGQGFAEELTLALEERFLQTGTPRDLTLVFTVAQGNRQGRGWTGCATRAWSSEPSVAIGACRSSSGRWPWRTRSRRTTCRRYTTSSFMRLKLSGQLSERGLAPYIYESRQEALDWLHRREPQ